MAKGWTIADALAGDRVRDVNNGRKYLRTDGTSRFNEWVNLESGSLCSLDTKTVKPILIQGKEVWK